MRPLALVIFLFLNGLLFSTHGTFADPNPLSWENWKTDFNRSSVPMSEITSGGPPKDGIPAIDNPKFVAAASITNIQPNEPVIGFSINGDARAYPLAVLMWHEIANDVVGGKAVAITFCPLCNAAIVFDAEINGERLDFGTTGRLRNSDLVMYDRQSESWWQQFSGEAIIGKYLGTRLKILPSRLESFANFNQRFPDGKVLVPENPGLRNYGQNPYAGYDTLATPWMYQGAFPDGIAPMARVVVVRRKEQEPIVVSMAHLRKRGSKTLDGYTLSWTKGQASALDVSQISKGRDVGNIVVTRQINGDASEAAYDVIFAFVAHAFHPDAEIIK